MKASYKRDPLRLLKRRLLLGKSHERDILEAGVLDDDSRAWQKLSEMTLISAWDNPGDDVFNKLLKQ